jgi:hypothetical protein
MTWTGSASAVMQIEAAASQAHVEVSKEYLGYRTNGMLRDAALFPSSWGGARSARGRRTLPRHAQPGIHEYTAQTLAGG